MNYINCNVSEEEYQKYKKKLLYEENLEIENKKAEIVVLKFLEENPDINIDCVFAQFKRMLLSSTQCATKLGISPRSFLRLRKKFNIKPISVIKKRENPKKFAPFFSPYSIKNYYNKFQLAKIPQSEIDLVQKRAAQSLKLPNKVKWKPRGYHSNGKLKARVDCLQKYGIYVLYNFKENKYTVKHKEETLVMSKKEVESLNLKYLRLKGFV